MSASLPPAIPIGFGFLVLASSLAFQAMPGRPVQYPFAFGAFALFLVVGPDAIWIVVAATGVGMLLHRSGRSGATGPALVGGAVSLGLLVGAALGRLLHVDYPLPVDGAQTLLRFGVVQGSAYVTFVLAKELGNSFLARPQATSGAPAGDTLALYVAGFVLGAPIQLAAHTLYRQAHPLPWTFALFWALLVNRVLGRQFARMRWQNELGEKLRRKERLVAIGEMTARVLHHTRHQMGLVGMIAHQIGRHLDGVAEAAATPIRQELTKLAAVREDLQHALTVDLGDATPLSTEAQPAHPSYETLIRAQSALLQPLASERAVEVSVVVAGDLFPLIGPNNPVKLAQAFLNVLENAISAARSRVTVRLERDGTSLVIGVYDDGPGMDPALLMRATDPFVSTKPGSSGMGLAITRAVVEEEEGELEIANRSGGGLAVMMRLPALSTRSRSAPPGSPAGSGPARRAPARSASRGS